MRKKAGCTNEITKLPTFREKVGLTQNELAEKSGINLRTIQKYEGGEVEIEKMSLKNASSIARVLGVKIEDLL